MNFFARAYESFLQFINNIAVGVSETFTGNSSGSILVIIMFYLVAAILIIFLLKAVVFALKGLYYSICKKTPKSKSAENRGESVKTAANMDAASAGPSVTAPAVVVSQPPKAFTGKLYLDSLSEQYNKVNNIDKLTEKHEHIFLSTPALLPISNYSEDVVLTNELREKVVQNIEGKTLEELKKLVDLTDKKNAQTKEKAKSLVKALTVNCENREKLAKEELSASEKYNAIIDELSALRTDFDNNKALLSVEYSELFNFISDLEIKHSAVLEELSEIETKVAVVPEKVEAFNSICEKNLVDHLARFSNKEEILDALKDSFKTIGESRAKLDETIISLQKDLESLANERAVSAETLAVAEARIIELEKAEKERLAREEAERKAKEEAERKAREEAERRAKLERERLAKLEAERLEKERLAKEEAERLEKERLAKEAERREQDRKAREEAERLEKERKAREEEAKRIEQERKAREEAERVERERLEKEAAEKAAKLEQERLAREEAERKAREEEKTLPDVPSAAVSIENQEIPAVEHSDAAPSIEIDKVKDQIQNQAQTSYALNFDNIPPEMYEKLAISAEKRKQDKKNAVKVSPPGDEDIEGENVSSVSDDISRETTDAPAPNSTENNSGGGNSGEESNGEEINYVQKLKAEWAAARAHKEEWASEQARKKAEEERRRKELSKEWDEISKPNND